MNLTDAVAAMHEAERAADAAIVAAFDQAAKVRRQQRRLDRLRADSAEKRRAFEDARDAMIATAEGDAAKSAEHEHRWERRQNRTSSGYLMPAYEVCTDCDFARYVEGDG